jgi:signal transduction histidine kinase
MSPARCVLLLVEHAGNRDRLADWLSRSLDYELAGDVDSADLVIVDGPAFAAARPLLDAARRRARPVFLPCLFLTPNQDVGMVTADLWQTVDEVLTTPIQPDELRVRIERLLATRDLSLESAQAAEALQRSNDDLERYAFVVAHELLSPLSVVSGVVTTIRRRYAEPLPEPARQLLASAEEAALRMQGLVDDVLAYSRLESGQPEDDVDTAALLQEVIHMLGPAVEEAGAHVTVGALPVVTGDYGQLRLVFRNLLANAIKYRRPDAPPRIEISAEREEEGWRVTVADDGVGIHDADRDAAFDFFSRGRSTLGRGGSGIGLAICRRIVELHGGRIWSERRDPTGTRFHVLLRA